MSILYSCSITVVTLAFLLACPAYADSGGVSQSNGAEVLTDSASRETMTDRPEHDIEVTEQMASYSRIRNIWRFVSFGVHIAILGLIAFSGLAARLRDWVAKIRPGFLSLWVFTALILAVDYLLYLPFTVYRGFVVESNYGFLNLSFFGWWGESLLGLLVRVCVAIIPVWLLYQCLKRFRRWWLVFTGLLAPVIVFSIVLSPIIVSPLFNDFVPLQDKQVESEIRSLAECAGIGDADIFEVNASKQSSRINAYVTGLFGSKRIVLYDTLLDKFTLDEVKSVMAHEIGHYVMHHVWLGTSIAVTYLGLLFWLLSRWAPKVIGRQSGRLRLPI